ncbi:hypothetical protein BCR44DRAFT_1444516 [Catenaria anguillulae PL171]|uniref:Uncharacterized protein n=1 Tax=Catenaria anguillulae PL171 TaxID=765915 RepID=A0A1Y2H7J5_9FUNG|nr:hypothetical protein BCR44DRAFT_1444516 [Catenaria anguillulae PL171]
MAGGSRAAVALLMTGLSDDRTGGMMGMALNVGVAVAARGASGRSGKLPPPPPGCIVGVGGRLLSGGGDGIGGPSGMGVPG